MNNNLPIKIVLPEHFLDEEVRCGHTITTKMKKVWAVELDLLLVFKQICDKYKLQWSISGGTALGAIRHRGFIPWDDDIDIDMPRKDYDILCKVIKKELDEPYFFSKGNCEKQIFMCHATLRNSMTTAIYAGCNDEQNAFNQGIFIDIFALDTIPEENLELTQFIQHLDFAFHRCQKIMCWADKYTPKIGYGILAYCKRLSKHVYALLTKKIYYAHMSNLLRKYENVDSKYCANLTLFPFERTRIFIKAKLFNCLGVDFEWLKMPVHNDVVHYLSTLYGDWKKPVKGASLHNGIYFDPEHPYWWHYQNESC